MNSYTLHLIVSRHRRGAGYVCVMFAFVLPVAEQAAFAPLDQRPRSEYSDRAALYLPHPTAPDVGITGATAALRPLAQATGMAR